MLRIRITFIRIRFEGPGPDLVSEEEKISFNLLFRLFCFGGVGVVWWRTGDVADR